MAGAPATLATLWEQEVNTQDNEAFWKSRRYFALSLEYEYIEVHKT